MTLSFMAALAFADDSGTDRIVFEPWRQSYTYYRGDCPVAKGNLLFDISTGYSKTGGELFKSTRDNIGQFSLSLNGSKFILDKISLGIAFDYSHSNIKGSQIDSYNIGPQISVFYENEHIYGYPFARFSPVFASWKGGLKSNGLGFSGEIGFAYFAAYNFAATVSIGYNYFIMSPIKDSTAGNTLDFRIGIAKFLF
jgi:hypothetical protein